MSSLVSIMQDHYANYVFQMLMKKINNTQRMLMIKMIQTKIIKLA